MTLAAALASWLRRTLGTAVFSGMLGVTLFGILLPPVFFFVIDWLTARKPLPALPQSGAAMPEPTF